MLRERLRQTGTCGPGKEPDWQDRTRTQGVGPIGKGGPSPPLQEDKRRQNQDAQTGWADSDSSLAKAVELTDKK